MRGWRIPATLGQKRGNWGWETISVYLPNFLWVIWKGVRCDFKIVRFNFEIVLYDTEIVPFDFKIVRYDIEIVHYDPENTVVYPKWKAKPPGGEMRKWILMKIQW
jgi:hypothetical protein